MSELVCLETSAAVEGLIALFAPERLLSRVGKHVSLQVSLKGK